MIEAGCVAESPQEQRLDRFLFYLYETLWGISFIRLLWSPKREAMFFFPVSVWVLFWNLLFVHLPAFAIINASGLFGLILLAICL